MSALELALQRNKYKHLSDEEWRWFLQQVEGRERTADKLPMFAAIEDWWYPVRLSCEQCSSELTARYKAGLVESGERRDERRFIDLTAGYGVDTYFISEHFEHTDYVEQNEELCRIAEHNFSLIDNRKSIIVHHTTAEEFLASLPFKEGSGLGSFDLIYADPARRDAHGGKVFRLEDCTPNIVALLPSLLSHLTPNGRILLKLSPMLDLTQALKELSAVAWDVHVVAVKNEVKEVLLLSGGSEKITAIDLDKKDQAFVFTKEEEQEALYTIHHTPYTYLYEPNAAILKAGGYKLVAQRFGLHKLDVNTHLYASNQLIENFPGRVWQIKSTIINHKFEIKNANILVRNYPLTPEQLKKKLHLRDGGTAYVIGCRVAGKPTLFYAERV
ncbi:MAG: class I SAM-dependent methyltransferase [Paludibacteraceae bacterium]|nr:class I SAM-dependent methyltransferase [Paludibacteraceae bacterium]